MAFDHSDGHFLRNLAQRFGEGNGKKAQRLLRIASDIEGSLGDLTLYEMVKLTMVKVGACPHKETIWDDDPKAYVAERCAVCGEALGYRGWDSCQVAIQLSKPTPPIEVSDA